MLHVRRPRCHQLTHCSDRPHKPATTISPSTTQHSDKSIRKTTASVHLRHQPSLLGYACGYQWTSRLIGRQLGVPERQPHWASDGSHGSTFHILLRPGVNNQLLSARTDIATDLHPGEHLPRGELHAICPESRELGTSLQIGRATRLNSSHVKRSRMPSSA